MPIQRPPVSLDDTAMPEAPAPDSPEMEAGSAKVGMLPLSILGGSEPEVGDTITLTIKAVRDDQIEVENAGPAEPEEAGEESEDADMEEEAPPAEPTGVSLD